MRRGSCPVKKSSVRKLTCGLCPPATRDANEKFHSGKAPTPHAPLGGLGKRNYSVGRSETPVPSPSLRSLREKFPFLSFLSLPFRKVLRFGGNLAFSVRHRGSRQGATTIAYSCTLRKSEEAVDRDDQREWKKEGHQVWRPSRQIVPHTNRVRYSETQGSYAVP